jgi:hypothetical protein
LAMMEAAERPEVWHQAGVQHIAQARKRYQQAGLGARLAPFIEDMAEAYAWADLVICRGGALTVSELAAAGVASILVPYPHSVDDHQTRNAQFLAQVQAAIVMPQGQFTAPGSGPQPLAAAGHGCSGAPTGPAPGHGQGGWSLRGRDAVLPRAAQAADRQRLRHSP